METAILYRVPTGVYIGIMENKMETTIWGLGFGVAVKKLSLSCHILGM